MDRGVVNALPGRWQRPLLSPDPPLGLGSRPGELGSEGEKRPAPSPRETGAWQDQTFPGCFPQQSLDPAGSVTLGIVFAGWGDPLPLQPAGMCWGRCQGRVIPLTGPSLGVSGLLSPRFRALELSAPLSPSAPQPGATPGCPPALPLSPSTAENSLEQELPGAGEPGPWSRCSGRAPGLLWAPPGLLLASRPGHRWPRGSPASCSASGAVLCLTPEIPRGKDYPPLRPCVSFKWKF